MGKLSLTLLIAITTSTMGVAAQTDIRVATTAELVAAVSAANQNGGNRRILLADGTYTLSETLQIQASDISLIGASGDRTKVVIQGDAMSPNASVGSVIRVTGKFFTASDLTLARSRNHLIQIVGEADADNAVIRNCILRDSYEQMLKISLDVNNRTPSGDNGLVENCIFEYTAGVGPQYYIGGVDGHGAKNWVVRGNTFRNIKSPDSTAAEHAVHFWTDSADMLVENNLILDCDRGIGFGLLDPASNRGAQRGIIRNNIIYSSAQHAGPATDVGIVIESTPGVQIYNNTVVLETGYPNAIEYRYATSAQLKIVNNLTNTQIRARDGAQAELGTNLTTATSAGFVNLAMGNLHLAAQSPAIDSGTAISTVTTDIDLQPRPQGRGTDIGADEFTAGTTPNPPGNLTIN